MREKEEGEEGRKTKKKGNEVEQQGGNETIIGERSREGENREEKTE